MTDRIPPQNLEAESALIGCLLQEERHLDDVADMVRFEDFYSPACATLFASMLELRDGRIAIDKISVVGYLRREKLLDRIGGPQFLTQLMYSIPTVASIEHYAREIAEAASFRRLAQACRTGLDLAFDQPSPSTVVAADVMALVDTATAGRDVHANPSGAESLAQAFNFALDKGSRKFVTSPFERLNKAIGGFYPGGLYVWAGAPKVGKTNMEVCVAEHVGKKHGTVAIFAIEMGHLGVSERRLALASGVSVIDQRSKQLTRHQVERMTEELGKLQAVPIMPFDFHVRSIPAMRRALRKLSRDGPIESIFVDHVGLMDEVQRGAKGESKVERLERTYIECKRLGSEFNCPVHVIQHINREGSKSKSPTEHDIRDGGNPNGLADATFIIHRPDPQNEQNEGHLGELIISSTRNGTAGIIPMVYTGARGFWQERTQFNSQPPSLPSYA
jgi:replicative DNA helicase